MHDEGMVLVLSAVREFELMLVNEIQSGTFGGPGMGEDILYAAGSDDFRGYVWEIPDARVLVGLRQEISADEWYSQEWPNVAGMCNHMIDEVKLLMLFQPIPRDFPALAMSLYASRLHSVG